MFQGATTLLGMNVFEGTYHTDGGCQLHSVNLAIPSKAKTDCHNRQQSVFRRNEKTNKEMN